MPTPRGVSEWFTDSVAAGTQRLPVGPTDFVHRIWSIFTGRRVPGLAAEAAFWAVFSLPWLMLALVSGLGIVSNFIPEDPVAKLQVLAEDLAAQVLTPEAAAQYAQPVINEFLGESRPDLGVLGLILAIWAGSRAVLTYVDAIALINGEFGARGYVRRRILSVVLYFFGALLAILLIPMVLIGPERLGAWFDLSATVLWLGYVILSAAVALILIVFLFHYAAFTRLPIRTSLPGALIAVVSCAVACVGLAFYVRRLFNQSSVYGVLATPIALMIVAYVISLMILFGAAYNAVHAEREIFRSRADTEGRFRRGNRVLQNLAGSQKLELTTPESPGDPDDESFPPESSADSTVESDAGRTPGSAP